MTAATCPTCSPAAEPFTLCRVGWALYNAQSAAWRDATAAEPGPERDAAWAAYHAARDAYEAHAGNVEAGT